MALVFPSNPNVNDTYTVNGRTYVWNGTTWRTIKAPVPDVLPTLSVDNNFSAGGTLHVDSVNNEIGIGTAAPSHQLHLTQDLGVDGNLIVGGNSTFDTNTLHVDSTNNRVGIGTTSPTSSVDIRTGLNPIRFSSSNGTNYFDVTPYVDDTDVYRIGINHSSSETEDVFRLGHTASGQGFLKVGLAPHPQGLYLGYNVDMDVRGWLSVNSNTVWHAGNDGASSGLDADLLDGNHASAFATSSHTHSYLPLSGGTMTGSITIASGSSTNAFAGGSNFWRPQDAYGNSYFDINSGQFYVDSDVYYFRNRASTNSMTIDSSGNTYIRGTLETSGRIYPRNWIEFSEHEGLYSPLNAAHFYPNNASYGSWRVAGSRNSWQGLEFDTSNGQLSLMMTSNGNWHTGVHANGAGWRWYFINQDLYCNAYRGFNNVAGTGNASYHPNGIYSTGTNWLYGNLLTNGNDIGNSSQRVGQVWSTGWFRTAGQTGWYNDSYGGGIYMTDSEYVKVYASKAFEINRWGGSSYDDSTLYLNTAQGGTANIGFHPGGQAPQIRCVYNDNSFYFRNYPDTGWAGVFGIIYNQSSRRYKQDISDFANYPSTLSGAADTSQARSGLEIVRALRPRHYRWNWEQQMRQLPLNERRAEALRRLNRYRRKNGLPEFTNNESWHECGRDCEGTLAEPCWRYKDWESGYFGFIAEEVGEVAPEAGRPDPETGELSALDSLAISAILTAALQELDNRLTKLEATNV